MGYVGGNDLSASCLLVILLFSSLLLFPMDVWFFEVKKNFSVHIGWSYFIGWVVFVMYIFCGECPGGPWEEGDVGVGQGRESVERWLTITGIGS